MKDREQLSKKLACHSYMTTLIAEAMCEAFNSDRKQIEKLMKDHVKKYPDD